MKKPVSKKGRSIAASESSPAPAAKHESFNDQSLAENEQKNNLPEKYTELYDFAPTGFFTLGRDASICELNLSGALLLGDEKAALAGKNFAEFVKADTRKTFDSFFKKVFEINVKTSCEVMLVNPFNPLLYVHIEGIVMSKGTKCLLVVADITERHKAEEALQTRDKIFHLSLDMHCIAGFDGYFKVLNPSWTRVLGWATEELMAKPWIEFIHPDDKEVTEQLESAIASRSEMLRFETRFRCSDGIYKRLEWNAFPNPSEKTMISIASDITDKDKAEEKIITERNLLRMLIHNLPDAIYVKDSQGRKIIT
ncbi:MAG: PAS domain S-box protein, partial [Ferruginibacter sp.]